MAARMVSFKNNKTSERYTLENKYNTTRYNLLLVIGFTLINIVLLVTNSDRYFLFSAYIPYTVATLGMILCGKYPLEYYGGGSLSDYNFMDQTAFVGFIALAIILVALYVLAYVFSKKLRPGWLIFALVIFILDTLFMFIDAGIQTDMIIDYLFHIWVIVSLAIGMSAGYKLKKLPPEEEKLAEEAETVTVSADPEE